MKSDKIYSRAAKMERAIKQLEQARKNMDAAYRPGELNEPENPLAALDVALHNADCVLAMMYEAIVQEAAARRGGGK